MPQDGNSRVVVHGGSQRVGLHPPGLLVETLPFGNDGQAGVDFPSSVRIVKVEGHFMRCRVASASVAQAVGIGCLVAFRQGVQGFIVRTVEKAGQVVGIAVVVLVFPSEFIRKLCPQALV